MSIQMQCPNPACARAARLADAFRGRWVRCPACHHKFQVPADAALGGARATHERVLGETLPTTSPGRPPRSSAQTLPAQVGRFVIQERLGAGAFGAVYRALDPHLQREVALKVPHPGSLDSPRRIERFLREGKAAAGLCHPHIVPVYDAGRDGPHHYIASAFVPGRTLAAAVADGPLDCRRAAELVRQLAEALAYAHGRGVVHRDVKPANVMLDEHGEAHLMDFGLAHRGEGTEKLTQDGAVMGTPAYMAPEQAAGQQGDPLPASDQYGLGAVLYELLTGVTPFSGPPAIVLYNVLHRDPEPPRTVNAAVPADLETVCVKALAKRPEDRYPNCRELADDLRRWLEGEPVRARRLSVGERCLRWVKREPRLAALVALTAVCLLVGSGLATARAWELDRKRAETAGQQAAARAEEDEARTQEAEAEQQRENAEKEARAEADAQKKADKGRQAAAAAVRRQEDQTAIARKAEDDAKKQEAEARDVLYKADLGIARRANAAGDRERARVSLARSIPEPDQDDPRKADWHDLWMSLPPDLTNSDHIARLTCIALSPTTLIPASGSADHTVRVRYSPDQAPTRLTGLPGTVTALAFDRLGGTLASAAGTTVQLSYINGGKVRANLRAHAATVTALAFSPASLALRPDSQTLASAASGEKVIVWHAVPKALTLFDGEATTWKPLALESKPGVVRGLAFSPDGKTLAGTSDAAIWLWDVATGKRRGTLAGHAQVVSCMAFSPDGKTLASGADDRTVRLWDVARGKLRATLAGHQGPVQALSFSPDGTTLATGSTGSEVWLWDVVGGKGIDSLAATVPDIRALGFSSDGRALVAISRDLTRKAWPLTAGKERLTLSGRVGKIVCLGFSPDGRLLAVGGEASAVRVWNVETGKECGSLEGGIRYFYRVTFSPDGKTLAVNGTDKIRLWDVATGKERSPIACKASHLAFSPDGKSLVTCEDLPGVMHLWDVATGKEKGILGRQRGFIGGLVYSPDGNTLATVSRDEGLKLWDLATGTEKRATQWTGGAVGVSFAPDGKTLVVAGNAGSVGRLTVDSTQQTIVLRNDEFGFQAFSPDARAVAAFTGKKTIRIWDLSTGKEKAVLPTYSQFRMHTAFSPDGRTVAVGDEDGTVKLWDIRMLPGT